MWRCCNSDGRRRLSKAHFLCVAERKGTGRAACRLSGPKACRHAPAASRHAGGQLEGTLLALHGEKVALVPHPRISACPQPPPCAPHPPARL
eukprot:366345-Chlamydomonas_euryale.AAC.14